MNSDLYKFKSTVCIALEKAVGYFDGDPGECGQRNWEVLSK
jgi:hypothetical protein